ncbi:MAG: DNA double-strand break repair nuclease NurA [Acidimicrobiales bacterium]
MKYTVESWDPDYGTGGDVDALSASTDTIDPDVEIPATEWRPITARSASAETVHFVDGVRRIDARIWVTDNGRVLPGSCATVAAGAVVCHGDRAEVVDVAVWRGVFTPAATAVGSIDTTHGRYEHVVVASGSPEDLYLGIHEKMTELETSTVPDAGAEDLVVFDGPLRGRKGENVVGLIKTQHVQYLDDDLQRVVATLDAGQRTPLFLIGARGFTRWSWYLRLPGPRTHGWAGIVRCEAPGVGSIEDAAALADQVAATLPRFASEPHKESRAPQNLYPIRGLEYSLRRRLGDQRLLERALRTASITS